MIWLKAFGLTLGVNSVIYFGIVAGGFEEEVTGAWPDFLQGLAIGASAILSTFLWKKVLEQP